MYTYSDKSKWNNSITIHLILSLGLWLPVVSAFVYIAIESGEPHFYLLSFSVSIFWGLALFKRSQTNLVFPTIEISDMHMIVNTTINRRAIYNLEYIEAAKFYLHILYFRHNKWPVLVPLPRMAKTQRELLLKAINCNSKK